MSPKQLFGREGYILTNFKAILDLLENLNGSALLKGELKINK